ncbi:MAG: L-fucose mutarotase [Alphaproteobacteria bacterium MarineAlpha5_Bin2]|jgi:L-fucose mutarotase|nr:MAG: L-fucose mutarotase [Alphaproteobacteria bacterium MarineAlpha5_Bin2]
MLINIDPILSPELLHALRSMGHGDKLVLADANFPSASLAKKLIRLDGVNIPNAAKAILSVLPLDSFVDYPVERMEIDDNPDEINDVHQDLIDVLKISAGDKWKVGSIERFKFYEEAKQAYMIVSTTDARAFGCFIITKGVIKPDGSVW